MANRKRAKQIAVRVNDAEYEEIMSQVKKSGMTQQEFFIKAIRETTVTNLDGLKEVVPEMKKAGNNLNQIAHKINSGEFPSNTEFEQLRKEYGEVWQLLRQLIHAQA